MRRLGLALSVVAIALVAALPAAAKEGVKATLRTSIPLDAPAGTRLPVAWTLASADGTAFGARGIFVRLASASGAKPQTAFARGDAGEYTATVRVPEGGIGDVEIGLRGFTSGANGTHNADVLFPITNDPLPGAARIVDPDGRSWTWLLAGAALLSTLAIVAVLLARRSMRGGARSIPSAP